VIVDLSDGDSFANGFPHDFFRTLRNDRPVYWHEPTAKTPDGEGFWVVSRHADVMEVQRNAELFSSDRGGGLRERGGTGIKDERSAGTMLNQTDGQAHRRLRSLVNRGFTPRAVASLEPELRSITGRLLDGIDTLAAAGEPFDAVHHLAREVPSHAICLVLGVPSEDRRRLLDWLDAGIESAHGQIVSSEATAKIREYAQGLIAAKRRVPDGGIMSTIIEARVGEAGVGEAGAEPTGLTDRELVGFFALLFPAGAETTRSALAGGLLALAQHPDQYQRLRDEPALIPTAVEEIVRWTTPSVYKRRTACAGTTLAGQAIGAGDKVTFWEMSANRDERAFVDPFRFDVGRDPNPHVGFGWGEHFCLGAGLARLEMRVVMEGLLERYSGFELASEPQWTPNNRLFGLKRLLLRPIPIERGGQ
jgi:cytochrome P450